MNFKRLSSFVFEKKIILEKLPFHWPTITRLKSIVLKFGIDIDFLYLQEFVAQKNRTVRPKIFIIIFFKYFLIAFFQKVFDR